MMDRITNAWQRGTLLYVGFRYLATAAGASVASLANRFILCGQQVSIRRPYRLNGILNVQSEGTISIGANVVINSGIGFNPIGGDSGTWLCTRPGGVISIGDNVRISNSTIFSAVRIEIGNNTFIGGSCKIYDTDFHPMSAAMRNDPATINEGKSCPVTIGPDCFIGAHSIILKGTKIGADCVIGAGSVVSGTVPPSQIWGGNPARFIRDNS